MRATIRVSAVLLRGASIAATAAALTYAPAAMAQLGAGKISDTPAQQAGEREAAGKADKDVGDIVVTGSRINRAGFDQPTPTTVIGDVELRQGARANIAQVLNDQPQFRATVSPSVSVGNTTSGTAPVDLRGLGTVRTLVLLNGRRFVGNGNLNLIPSGLVRQVEVVTGGASAAYGSSAVAGVVNILLNKELTGLTLGGSGGISSRGDAGRYQLEGSYGTRFADDRGRIILGAEYVNDQGIRDRNSRPALGSTGIVRVNPADANGLVLAQDVNYPNRNSGGVIMAGPLAGLTFNPDGTLRPFQGPNAQGIGGADAIGLYDDVYASTPFERYNGYGRLSYEIVEGSTLWIEGIYGRAKSRYPFFPDLLLGSQTLSATNPYLLPQYRNQLTAAGQGSFTVGRVFNDIFLNTFDLDRENKEGAVGVDGDLGGSFTYSGHFSYGTVDDKQKVLNSRIAANYTRAVNAVTNGAGQIVCAVNADAITTNDDPACAPLNILGSNAASPAALAYVRGVQTQRSLTKLISGGFQVQGDLLRLPAGPLTVAAGFEGRRESLRTTRDPLTSTPGYFGFQLYAQDIIGEFSVKEEFVEAALPVIDIENKVKLDLNGAARYSDYSTSGGIWSWKVGGTARFFNDLLLRSTLSRDIRSPNVTELFSTRATIIGTVTDLDSGGRSATLGYNPTPSQVFTFSGGNPLLVPEIGKTFTGGGSYSPSFFKGFSLSADYYHIKITGAIAALNGSNLTLACKEGNAASCARVIRDSTGTITMIFANLQNLASFTTSGIDFEASYFLPMSRVSSAIDGSLRIRALATYVSKFITNDGRTSIDRVGDVGNTVAGVPKWRATLSMTYQSDTLGLDARVRYVDGGKFDHTLSPPLQTPPLPTLVNNDISSRTYLDLGAQFKVMDRFTLFGNVNNVFDRKPPLSTVGPVHYDVIGTFFTMGARVKF